MPGLEADRRDCLIERYDAGIALVSRRAQSGEFGARAMQPLLPQSLGITLK